MDTPGISQLRWQPSTGRLAAPSPRRAGCIWCGSIIADATRAVDKMRRYAGGPH